MHAYAAGLVVIVLLLLPTFFWALFDKGIWRGDPVGYALNCMMLYKSWFSSFAVWKGCLFNGYKAPLLFWIGQFAVALGTAFNCLNFSLLLVPLAAVAATLLVTYHAMRSLFGSYLIALTGCVVTAASPMFLGLATGFWIEPLQVALTAWFIYLLVVSPQKSISFLLPAWVAGVALTMLVKVSSVLYIIGPLIIVAVRLWQRRTSFSVNRQTILPLAGAGLLLLAALVFYLHNMAALLAFARFASTSFLFSSDASKLVLWNEHLHNGLFLPFTYQAAVVIVAFGGVYAIWAGRHNRFLGVPAVAVFQIGLFFVAWVRSANVDPRYFLPALPYFVLLVCWALSVVGSRLVSALTALIFLYHFALSQLFLFGRADLSPAYGMIRPIQTVKSDDVRLLEALMPMATRDSSVVFDLNPELGVAEFQYELGQRNVQGNWNLSSADVSAFFDIQLQQIDTASLAPDLVWHKLMAYKPDYYITWRTRLNPALVAGEMNRIDKYNALTVPVRWAVAQRMNQCDLYERQTLPGYEQLLVYKRKKQGL